MKYKPRQSNFDEFADEVVGRILEVKDGIETIKDAIGEEIDDYVDAVIAEQLEQRHFLVSTCGGPTVMFCLGEDHKVDGQIDLFYAETTLEQILKDLEPDECDEQEDAVRIALMLEAAATRFREQVKEIAALDAEYAKST